MVKFFLDSAPNHTKIYYKAFGYTDPSECLSEISDSIAVDIHHIDARGIGGSSDADCIENLMALTRDEHNEYGDIRELKALLYSIHRKRLLIAGVDFNLSKINAQIAKYKPYLPEEYQDLLVI